MSLIQKLNHIVHDSRSGTIFISLRPRSKRQPETTLDFPGKILLDLDSEGDIYGVRMVGVTPREAERILKLLKAKPAAPVDPGGEKAV